MFRENGHRYTKSNLEYNIKHTLTVYIVYDTALMALISEIDVDIFIVSRI